MENGYPPFHSPDVPSNDDPKSPSFFLKVKLFILSHYRVFKKYPFDYVDKLYINVKIRNRTWDLNFLKYDVKLRKIIFYFSWIIFGIWILLGWDSSQSQFEFVAVEIPNFIMGRVSFEDLSFIYADQYGKGMHYSAWTIYGLMAWGLMKYYDEKLDIHGCRNFALAFSFTMISIASFETFWHYSFAIFQDQTWVIQWKVPQLKILIQNLSFFIMGSIMIFVMKVDEMKLYRIPGRWKVFDKIRPFKIPYPSRKGEKYLWSPKTNYPHLRFNFNKITVVLIIVALSSSLLWINYGLFFPVERFSVEVVGYGTWTNNIYFPQTVYTIEIDLTDNINAGDQYFVENDLLHGVNTLCKVLITLLSYYIGRVKRVEKPEIS